MRISDWSSDVCSSDLADREHEPEQRQIVEAVTDRREYRESADQRHRNREHRNDRSAPFLQEDEDHDHHEHDRFEQRVHHRVDRLRSEEHTSELQSLMRISYAVFCLKQKTTNIIPIY